MRIINTKNNLKRLSVYVFIVFSLWSVVFSLSACGQKSRSPQDDLAKSQAYYQAAVEEYKNLIAQGKDLSRLYFELGKVYYARADFPEAIGALQKSDEAMAKKFLAMAYYRQGDFTAAMEIFDKHEIDDAEYLYYKGLAQEKLNLFDPALASYRKIANGAFKEKALGRIAAIEKKEAKGNIKDIDPQVYKILSAAPLQEKYPQAGALILSCDESITVTGQDTQISEMHYLVKILNERGKEDFAETAIGYDSTYEKVELVYARTIKPDGAVVDVGSRHIRDVSKYLNFPLYSNARVYIISFPEIAEGAAIEYKVKIYRSQLINKKDFVMPYPLQATEPVIAADFTLSLPREKAVNLKTINEAYNNSGANLKPEIEEKKDTLVYRWRFKDIPQIVPEANMPPQEEINPTVFLSTFKDWQQIYQWWWKLAQDKICADPAIKDKVRDLVKGKNTPAEKARAIYNFCARQIRYVAVEYGQAGFEPHAASDVFRNKYGDCKDQAILLVTMLKEAGLVAHPVLIPTRDYYDLNPDFPSVLFDHCIAALELDGKLIFMDPTAETCSFTDLPAGDQGRRVFVCGPSGYKIEKTPLFESRHNLNKQVLKIKIETDGAIAADKTIFTNGIYAQAQRFWLLYTQPELIEATLKEKIQDISIGAKLDNYNIENLEDLDKPVVLSYSFRGPEYLTLAANLGLAPQLAGVDTAVVSKDSRKYPLDFGIPEAKETDIEIRIPQGFSIKYLPQNVSVDSAWVKFNVEYSQKDSKIYFSQSSELKKTIVTQTEYPEFKKFYEGLAKSLKQRIVLEKVK